MTPEGRPNDLVSTRAAPSIHEEATLALTAFTAASQVREELLRLALGRDARAMIGVGGAGSSAPMAAHHLVRPNLSRTPPRTRTRALTRIQALSSDLGC